MRIVGVSRVLDEADIIEPFIRHHAGLFDLHIVLDNGSNDGTVEILRALHREGIALEVYQTASPIFLEQSYNTGLYRLALAAGADWVVFCDADELLAVRDAVRPRDVLALVPDGIQCLRVPAYDYARPRPAAGAHPFTALRRRSRSPSMPKVAVRRLDPARVGVYAGNHLAFIDGVEELGLPQERLWLAHVPDRDTLQLARKAILSRLKPIASGSAAERHFGVHRASSFEMLKRDAGAWLREAAAAEIVDPVEDEVAYLGGALRYTETPDELARLLSAFASQMELLARSHGAILDGKRLIRREMTRKAAEITRLF